MRSMSAMSQGKSKALCPVCGSQMLMPLSKMVICSLVLPLIPISVCAPIGVVDGHPRLQRTLINR